MRRREPRWWCVRIGRRAVGNSLLGQAAEVRRNHRAPRETQDETPRRGIAGAATGQPGARLPKDAGAIGGVGRSCGKYRKACHPKCRVGPRFATACYRLTGLTRPRQKPSAAALPTSAPSSLRRAWGLAPRPFRRSASAPLPISPPFFPVANSKRRPWPIQNLFSPARSLAALTLSKKVLDGRPSAFTKTIPSMRKKGGRKTAASPVALALCLAAIQSKKPRHKGGCESCPPHTQQPPAARKNNPHRQ